MDEKRGMAQVPKERRDEINAQTSKKRKAAKIGWPKPVASFRDDPQYHQKVNDEWNWRVQQHKQKSVSNVVDFREYTI